jgi:hypothetical protein
MDTEYSEGGGQHDESPVPGKPGALGLQAGLIPR